MLLLFCSAQAPPQPVAGAELRARVEARVLEERSLLDESIGHCGLLFDVEQEHLARFMERIVLRRGGRDIVPGSQTSLELHGGGVLGILVDYWRPHGRPPRLEDRYPFSWSTAPVALAEIYRSHQNQIFLPVPGLPTDEIDGQIPDSPQLPRMRFRFEKHSSSFETTEVDSYTFLRILLEYEPDLGATWSNRLNQRLSVDLLLRNTWARYVSSQSAEAEFEDHSYLHLVELLLAFSRHRDVQLDSNQVKRRFLSVELGRTEFGGYEPAEALGHYTDSLGFLLGSPEITWSADEKRQVRNWLEDLERNRLREVRGLPIAYLTHLLRGLRTIERNQARLQ
jgi:hypothetical protein